jgi:biotin carboxylase
MPFARNCAMNPTRRLGLLFDYDFDAVAQARLAGRLGPFDRAGFDLFSFPSNLGLLGFDLDRFAQAQARRARRRGWAGVVSHQDQFGALAAALVAQAAGLPGTSPESIIACQHKLHARRVLERVCPEANLRFAELPCAYGDPVPAGLGYPCFVKPVKAAFSVLARRVDSRDELQAHTRFGVPEQWLIRRLVEPFDRVARRLLPEAGSAHRLMLEEPVHGPQYNLDGFVHEGQVHVLGVVDAIMYPGTQAFQRWQLPSRLPAEVVDRAADVAGRFLRAVGFNRGLFNLEFFFDEASGRLTVIEINPRLASQFGDLYRRVLGVDPHALALALAVGDDPLRVPRDEPTAAVAASLVWRAFSPREVPPMPTRARRAHLAQAFPDALLFTMPKSGHPLDRDFKWLDSHRYGLVHLGASDAEELRHRCERAAAILGWPNAPYAGGLTEPTLLPGSLGCALAAGY